jgi:hypothetical protein
MRQDKPARANSWPGCDDRRRRELRSLFFILVLGVLGCGRLATAAGEVSFEQYEVVTGTAKHQTVLPGFFLGGAVADIAVVTIDENEDRRLRIYAFGAGAWLPKLDVALGSEVLFIDVVEIGGRDRLILSESGHLNWFDSDSGAERTLVEVATGYRSNDEGGIPHVDITRDLNHDGRDDLVVPDVDGFWISTQSSDGSFTDPVKLGPPEPFEQHLVGGLDLDEGVVDDSRTYGDVGITAVTVPWYLSRVYTMDYDQDGLNDLVFWNQDHFDVYTQNERGLFDPAARTFTVDVPFDSDGAYSRMFDFSDQGAFSVIFGLREKSKRTVLHSFRDLNGDQVADLVTLTLAGRSVARQGSVYEVHFGRSVPGGTVFPRDVGTAIYPRGKAGGMQPWGYSSQWFEDFDGDGQVDVMLRDVNVGFGGMMRALLGNSVPIDLEFYRVEGGRYPDEPATKRKVRRFDPLAGLGNIFFPAVLMGDVNGDGRSDLLVGKSPEELNVFLGAPGPGLLARRPQKVAVVLPYDERNTWLVDLNKDGKQDLLMHHAPTDHAPTGTHRLTMLIAR